MRGSHSASLRPDRLTGREGRKEAMGLSMIPISDSTPASPLDKLQHKKIEVRLQKGLSGDAEDGGVHFPG